MTDFHWFHSRISRSLAVSAAVVLVAALAVGVSHDAHAERGDYSFMSRAGSESGFEQNEYPHERGFYARGAFGLGYLRSNVRDDGNMIGNVHGFAVDWQAALGGIVVPNVALHATFWGQTIPSPKFEIDGLGTVELDDSRASMFGLGAGATGYFGYSGMFLSGSLGAAKARIRFPAGNNLVAEENSDWGFIFDLMTGKEWIVGPGVGLGFALGGGMHIIPGENDVNARGFNLSARFILTLN